TSKYHVEKKTIQTHAATGLIEKMEDKEKGIRTKILFQGHVVVGIVLKRKKNIVCRYYFVHIHKKLLDGCDNAKRSTNNDNDDDHEMQSMFILLICQLFQYIGLEFCAPQYLDATAGVRKRANIVAYLLQKTTNAVDVDTNELFGYQKPNTQIRKMEWSAIDKTATKKVIALGKSLSVMLASPKQVQLFQIMEYLMGSISLKPTRAFQYKSPWYFVGNLCACLFP
ncbi:hypothetical protein RFI_09008, partial [Reticulomyxa filosa]